MYNLIYINTHSQCRTISYTNVLAKWLSDLNRTCYVYTSNVDMAGKKRKLIQSFPSYIKYNISFANYIHRRHPQIREQDLSQFLECRAALSLYSAERLGYTKRGSTRSLST